MNSTGVWQMSVDSFGKMQGGAGMSPRKAMAGGAESSAFGVKGYPGSKAVESPMRGMGTKGHMEDGERGIGMSVGGGKGMHGMQASPDHGPHHDHFVRDGKA